MAEKIIPYKPGTFADKASGPVPFDQPQVRKVAGITDQGEVFIESPGDPFGRCRARIATGRSGDKPEGAWASGDKVLVVYENGDPERPVIIGPIVDRIDFAAAADQPLIEARKEILFKGKRIIFESTGEVVLKCGDATITMKNDGKIVLRGKELVSRAARNNKIKGGAVKIN